MDSIVAETEALETYLLSSCNSSTFPLATNPFPHLFPQTSCLSKERRQREQFARFKLDVQNWARGPDARTSLPRKEGQLCAQNVDVCGRCVRPQIRHLFSWRMAFVFDKLRTGEVTLSNPVRAIPPWRPRTAIYHPCRRRSGRIRPGSINFQLAPTYADSGACHPGGFGRQSV